MASTSPDPPYARIVAEIRAQIDGGRLQPGDRLPSVREITRRWGVAIATATKVVDALRNLGVAIVRPGVGTLVATTASHPIAVARPPTRSRESELASERIVRAAIAIADAEGLAALSMRRIATQLGSATMALYRHVGGKDELVLAMAETVFGDNPPPSRHCDWRAGLEEIARLHWTIYRRHPWLAGVVSITRPQLMPRGMLHTEAVLARLDGLGLDDGTRLHAAVALIAHVRGMAMGFEAQAQAEQDTGMTDEQWLLANSTAFAAVIGSGSYPNLRAVTSDPTKSFDFESLFEFGLQRLLDGYAARFGA